MGDNGLELSASGLVSSTPPSPASIQGSPEPP